MIRRRIAGPFRAFTAAEWASMPIPCPFYACVTAMSRPKVDTSPAIHRCHAYVIVQGRLLHTYATPLIFNWDVYFLVWIQCKNYPVKNYYPSELPQ